MNGKRVRMAVMSAVILSALAVSGCSSEGSVSYNGSGEKADDVSASLSTPVTSDTTNSSESKETQEQTSYESKPAVTTTNKAETTAVTTKKDNAVKSEWKETKADGTKYVTVGCYSREEAVLGAKTVKLYNVNDKVTVVAVTDTGYAKLKDGTFIHNGQQGNGHGRTDKPVIKEADRAEAGTVADFGVFLGDKAELCV